MSTSYHDERFADFYQIPTQGGSSIINTLWIDYLWCILHASKERCSYHAAEEFESAATKLIDLVWSPSFRDILIWLFTRPHITRVLCTVDTILDSEQRLGDTCYELIRDISREIDSGSSVIFSASLRNRCKAANLTIEWETWRLERMICRQHEDFDPQSIRRALRHLPMCLVVLSLALFIVTPVACLCLSISEELSTRGFCLAYLTGHLLYELMEASGHLYNANCALYKLYSTVLRSVWAWRDMRGFLTLVADLSEGSQLSDASHARAQRFLDPFQVSFMSGDVELWKTRSKIQTLSEYADNVQAMKDQDAHQDATGSSIGRRNSALDLFQRARNILTGVYTKVSGLVSHGDKKMR